MAKKRKKKQNFWKRIRFQYKLSFLNENTLEEVFSVRLSRLYGFIIILFFASLLIFLTSIVIINTPIRNYLPGYMDTEVRNQVMNNAMRTDSLEQVVNARALFLNNVGNILKGEIHIDSIPLGDTLNTIDMEGLNRS